MTLATGGFIDVADAANLRLQTLTVSAWVRPQGPNTTADQFGDNIISKWTLNGGGTGSVALTWRASDGRFVLVVGGTTPTVVSTDGFSAGVLPPRGGDIRRRGRAAVCQRSAAGTDAVSHGDSVRHAALGDRLERVPWRRVRPKVEWCDRRPADLLARADLDRDRMAGGRRRISNVATVSITVTPVNDPPAFSLASGLHTAPFNGGPQTVPGWVTGISAGPANEASQTGDVPGDQRQRHCVRRSAGDLARRDVDLHAGVG